MEITLKNQQHEFTWIPAFKAISDWLSGFEKKQPELIEILKQLGVINSLNDRDKKDGNLYPLEHIDPFTFLSNLTKYGENKRLKLIRELITSQNIQTPLPMDVEGIPAAQPQNVSLFPYAYNRTDEMIPTLWRLFHEAMINDIKPDTFDSVLDIPRVGFAKLTQNLFYIDPSRYLQVDSITKPWLSSRGIELPDENYLSYQAFLNNVNNRLDIPFYQISHEAWSESQGLKSQMDTVSSIKTDYETEDIQLPSKPIISLNRILYGPPGTGKTYKTTELAVECVDPDWYQTWKQSPLSELERRQQIKSKYDELIDKGRIGFATFHQSFAYEDFVEGIRAETNTDTNQLSYSVKSGVFKSIVEEADKAFDKRLDETVSTYKALELLNQPKIWLLSIGQVSEKAFRDTCIDRNEARISWHKVGDLNLELNERSQAEQDYFKQCNSYDKSSIQDFAYNMSVGDVVICFKSANSIQAVGIVVSDYFYDKKYALGKEYVHTRKVHWILKGIDLSILSLNDNNNFLPITCYQITRFGWSDLVKKLRKQGINLNTYPELHYANNLNYMIIIDEINRGNISRIFGELITLLESDKRKGGNDSREATLPYSKEKFSVPSNLYVLGTMNTADKSLAQIDFALRRRFEFIELLPNPHLLADIDVFGINISDLLTIMNQRIEVLLDREHTIGHAYFWSLKKLESDDALQEELADIFKNRIIPLLQEYFFSDWERIGWVLNDPAKKPEHRFIQVSSLKPSVTELFHSSVTDQIMDRRYRINTDAFKTPEAYAGIISVHIQAD